MSRHILDRQDMPVDDQKTKAFVDIERAKGDAGPHDSTQSLHRRSRAPSAESRRAEAYLTAEHRGADKL